MMRNKVFLITGLAVLALFCLCAAFPAFFAPYGIKDMFEPWLPCSTAHLLGTNDMGYDIFSELIYSCRPTILIAAIAATASVIIGTSVGIAAGCLHGWAGNTADILIRVFMLIPMLPAAIVIVAFCGGGTVAVGTVIACLCWCGSARAVRAKSIQLQQTPFVESLVILGIPRRRIILRHILPNIQDVVICQLTMSVSGCIMTEATLSFLGLGDAGVLTWGRMINLAYKCGGFTRGAYNWLLSPGVCIALTVICFCCINHYFEERRNEVVSPAD